MKRIIIISIYIGLIIGISSQAQIQINKFGSKIFTKCDINKDGLLNETEYLKMSTKRFHRMDSNKDDIVTLQELTTTQLSKMMPLIAVSWFNRNDIDQDNVVTIKEIEQASNAKFLQIDANHDKQLSITEWLKFNPSFNK